MNRLRCILRPASWLACAIAIAPCAGNADAPSAAPGATSSTPPGFSMAVSGDAYDFDFMVGAWNTQQHRLKARNVASTTWVDSPGNQHCARTYLDGKALVEESRFPNGQAAGLFLYTFNPQKRQWAIYWVDPNSGDPGSPVVGGFDGTHGEFYADDEDGGHPIKVRVTWTKVDRDHARWEQAFSYDDRTWETNWIADFTRADPATVCSKS